MDYRYTEYILHEFLRQQQGQVVAVCATSDDRICVGKCPNASYTANADTVFEVGSTTKTFSVLAMLLLVKQGRLNMHDTLGTHLPKSLVLSEDVSRITMHELATHTSGLARMPTNVDPYDRDPMRNYDERRLYEYLQGLNYVGPKKFMYSNTGFALIGWITCLLTGKSWEQCVRELILIPLSMHDTTVDLSESQRSRLAPATAQGRPASATNFTDAFVGAGGLRSTAPDMLRYTKALAGMCDVSVDMRWAMNTMLQDHASDEFLAERGRACFGLQRYTARSKNVFWKDVLHLVVAHHFVLKMMLFY